MYITMKEFFSAYGRDLDDLTVLKKSATGFHEMVVFGGGVTSKLMRGRHTGDACVWLPQEAKELNKLFGATIYTPDMSRFLIKEPNNNNTLLYHQKGEIGILWIIPSHAKIVDNILNGLNGPYGSYCYIGHSLIMDFRYIGYVEDLKASSTYPELQSVLDNPDDFKNRLIDDLGYLEVAMRVGFFSTFVNESELDYLGYDDGSQYFINNEDRVLKVNFLKDERLIKHMGDLTSTSKILLETFEKQRL